MGEKHGPLKMGEEGGVGFGLKWTGSIFFLATSLTLCKIEC